MSIKTAIVFGGSGFLGSHICDQLTSSGYKVTIFDKKKSKFLQKNQKMVIGDITKFNQVQKAIKNKRYIFHFAGVADLHESNSKPLKAINFNILGTANILEAIKTNKINSRIIFASSIYARSKQGGVYSTTKRTCESLIENYSHDYKLNYTILRFGSLYGLRANNFNAIHQLILQGIKYKKIIRDGDGTEIRNYINVKDAAKICVEILKKNYINKYYNIMGQEKISVKKIIKLISKKTNTKKIIYRKGKPNNMHYKKNPFTYKVKDANFFKLKKSINLEEGIQEIIQSYSN